MVKVFVISDCHGNIDGLMRALEKKKIVDKHGNRQLARKHQVISIGDLANCVEDSVGGDLACLNLVGEIIDQVLIGNHEIPYFDPGNTFSGFKFDGVISQKIHSLMENDFIGAAALVDKTLVTHAGFSREFNPLGLCSQEVFNVIEDQWDARNFSHSWLSSIGYARGGNRRCGGIIWCDFDDEFMPTVFPQICGHTPRGVRMKGNSLCIDVGAKNGNTKPFILELL
jgi:Calcineurin-like phosphoesterase